MSESDESSDDAPLRTRSGAIRAIHTLPTPQTSRRSKEGIAVDLAPDSDDNDEDEELLPPLPSLPAPKQGKSSKLLLAFRAAHKVATDNPEDRSAHQDCLEAYDEWCQDENKKAKQKKNKAATKKTAKRARKDDEGDDDQEDQDDDDYAPSTTTVLSLSHTTAQDQGAIKGWLRGEGVLDGILDNRAAVTVAAFSVGQTVIRNQLERDRLIHDKDVLEQRKIDSQLSARRFKGELLNLKCRLLEMQANGVAVGDLQSVAKQLEELEAEQYK